jgi:chloramphenicol-sensitive protein RarD
MNQRAIAYGAFISFCILSSLRDSVSEALFKNTQFGASPLFVLFIYCVVTEIVAATFLLRQNARLIARGITFENLSSEIVLLNIFTLAAFLFYFLAISSPLGAALSAFVDYGINPILTAIVGAFFLQKRLNRHFIWSATASISGIVVLGLPRIEVDQVTLPWLIGLAMVVLSALSAAFFRLYFKILLQQGHSKSVIIFMRLIGLTVFLGIALAVRPDLFRSDLILETAAIGLLGFTLPLFLTLNILQRLELSNFAMLLFLYPALTFMISTILGYAQFYITDLIAFTVIGFGVIRYEYSSD